MFPRDGLVPRKGVARLQYALVEVPKVPRGGRVMGGGVLPTGRDLRRSRHPPDNFFII